MKIASGKQHSFQPGFLKDGEERFLRLTRLGTEELTKMLQPPYDQVS
ncbi:MAG: hypothetical protein ACREXS_00315 [Gammaproteobacteria bacterium]